MVKRTVVRLSLLVCIVAAAVALPAPVAQADTCRDSCWSQRLACVGRCGTDIGCKENCYDAHSWCLCSCDPAYCG